MPGRDDVEDEDDLFSTSPPPRRRQGSNPTVVVLIFLAALTLLGIAVLWWLFTRAVPDAPPQGEVFDATVIQPDGMKDGTRRVYTYDEFGQLVMQKTPEEVMAAVGRPDGAWNHPDGAPHRWEFRDSIRLRSGNVTTGLIFFANGRVSRIGVVGGGN